MTGRKIIHVDMDAFFASVEQRDHPELRGKPVAVGGSGGRGVVAAASYEARRFGVRSAMPSVTAARLCPDLIFVRHRFDVYRAVSRQIREIFADYTDLIEPLSLDEAYLDVTENRRGLPSATDTALEIRARILSETKLTASAGISYNKLLAKLASDMNKPNGQCVITPARGPDVVAGLEVGRFHGIGPKTAAKMNRMGIFTGADLRAQDVAFLERRFGKAGRWYHSISRGEDHRPVSPHRARKSSGSETTFDVDLTDPAAIEAGLIGQADDVWAWCEKAEMYGRTVTTKIKFADFKIATRSRTLPRPVADRDTLRTVAVELVRTIYPPRTGIRLLGVTVSGFAAPEPHAEAQMALVF
ncbi:DNA polymerase IV [Hephaestia mangrovi]|uniref:DNA polymerase IV n=1 Tax=Hephaestia mangrovi TaxID=2873268 RepID=UPI001CA65A9D|nr:DNA polymerase IV [Hephaestia mangrovi]MBY8827828.1 DNA polymerase IV [Hephaestia mangrovi]